MTDVPNSIQPGVQLSEKDREALAKENLEISNEAQRLASEHRARDMAEKGNEKPVLVEVADSVLEKLKALQPEKLNAVKTSESEAPE